MRDYIFPGPPEIYIADDTETQAGYLFRERFDITSDDKWINLGGVSYVWTPREVMTVAATDTSPSRPSRPATRQRPNPFAFGLL